MTENRHTLESKELLRISLELFSSGDRVTPFFNLVEADRAIVPLLIEAFNSGIDSEVREFLVEVIWQRGHPSTVPFLESALNDPEPAVWKQALDGLVTLGTIDAIEALHRARSRYSPTESDRREFQA
jgi:hypothetical protein